MVGRSLFEAGGCRMRGASTPGRVETGRADNRGRVYPGSECGVLFQWTGSATAFDTRRL